MIQLTRLNGHAVLVNADLIKHAESIPDTTLTLVTGDKFVVLESCDEVQSRTLTWRAAALREAWPAADAGVAAHLAHKAAHS